jgi:GDP-L-fucose synthase
MVGSALVRRLEAEGFKNILTRTRQELDLTDASAVDTWLAEAKPEVMIIAAAKVGGIHANNTYPAEFLYENLALEMNLIHGAYRHGVKRVLFLGSTCIYPRMAPQPIPEDSLLTSELEKTNEAYALAKIAGLKMCEYYRRQYGVLFHSAMPTNLYGPGDNYHPDNSHVLPALIRRFHEAKENGSPSVTMWGTGTPRREFLHVDDLADALFHLLELENPPDWVNAGTGEDIPIKDLAYLVKEVVGYEGTIEHDLSKPDGTPRKLTDTTRLRSTGWAPSISLDEGLKTTYQDFLTNYASGDLRAV